MNSKALAGAFAAGVAVAAVGWLIWRQAPDEPRERTAAELMDVVMWGKEPVGGPFSLIDHNGRPRTDADFRGRMLLVYFGFTSCSDACPIDLQSMAGALDRLGPAAEAVQPLFITVDPQKDTPEQLKSYVALFHPRLIGLTGGLQQIPAVERAYRVYARESKPSKEADPSIDHSSFVYLIDAAGKYIGFFPPGTSPDRMAEVIRRELAIPVPR